MSWHVLLPNFLAFHVPSVTRHESEEERFDERTLDSMETVSSFLYSPNVVLVLVVNTTLSPSQRSSFSNTAVQTELLHWINLPVKVLRYASSFCLLRIISWYAILRGYISRKDHWTPLNCIWTKNNLPLKSVLGYTAVVVGHTSKLYWWQCVRCTAFLNTYVRCYALVEHTSS